MNRDKPGTTIAVPVRCRVARVRRVNPFHWALLRALEMFPPGARPGMDVFAEKLQLGDRGFLEDAWKDLRERHAIDDAVFCQARLTLEGADALQSGYFVLGPAEERDAVLRLRADECGDGARSRLTRERVEAAWREQADEALRAGERVMTFRVDWARAKAIAGGTD